MPSNTPFPAPPMALGLMCGTFDPPHVGHLILAETAADQLGLAQVLFLPVGQPTHKSTLTAAHHRVAMTQLAIADNPRFVLNTADADRPPPHYTATLLPLLRQRYPNEALWLIMGGDSLRDLPHWHHAAALLQQCQLAVLERPGDAPMDWEALTAELPGIQTAVHLLAGLSLTISSTLIRHGLAHGQELRYALPSAVREYIRREGLYGE